MENRLQACGRKLPRENCHSDGACKDTPGKQPQGAQIMRPVALSLGNPIHNDNSAQCRAPICRVAFQAQAQCHRVRRFNQKSNLKFQSSALGEWVGISTACYRDQTLFLIFRSLREELALLPRHRLRDSSCEAWCLTFCQAFLATCEFSR